MIKKYLEKYGNIIVKIICFILLVFVYNFCMGCSNQIEKNTENDKIVNKYSVTDSTETVINFDKKPEKIVSLSISTDEILIDLVDSKRITAVTYLADDPEISNIVDRVKSIPNRAYGNSAEALLAMQPDVIIAADFFKKEMIQTLRDLGLKVYVYKTPDNIKEVKQAVEDIKNEILDNPSYQTTKAGKNKAVIMLSAAQILAVSQYTVDAVEELAKAVYPEKYK